MAAQMGTPPLQSGLPINLDAKAGRAAIWSKPWGNWFTQVWQALFFGWQWNTVTVTTAYTASLDDSVILINGDIAVKLPLINEAGPKRITVKVINAGGGTRTVDGNGANIDGAASVTTTTRYHSWDFVNDGTEWFIV